MDNPSTPEQNTDHNIGKNGNRLRRGNPGNKGGPGRPPDEIRQRLREDFYKNLAKIQKWAKSDDPALAMKAMEMQAKYGLGTPAAAVDKDGNQTDLPAVMYAQK